MGPLILTWVAIGGGADAPNPYNDDELHARGAGRRRADVESSMRNVLPLNMMAIAHGSACALRQRGQSWTPRPAARKMSIVEQVEQLVRICRGVRPSGRQRQGSARIYRIGKFYSTIETLAKNGFAPNRKPGSSARPRSKSSWRARPPC